MGKMSSSYMSHHRIVFESQDNFKKYVIDYFLLVNCPPGDERDRGEGEVESEGGRPHLQAGDGEVADRVEDPLRRGREGHLPLLLHTDAPRADTGVLQLHRLRAPTCQPVLAPQVSFLIMLLQVDTSGCSPGFVEI